MDFFAIATQGFYPKPTPSASQRMSYASSWGFISVLFEQVVTALFTDGQLLIRQPFSEDYLLDGTTLVLRLPWTEDYEMNEYQFIRQPFTEDRLERTTLYVRQPNSENYESDGFRFTRQPNSENYLIEAK